MRRAAAKARGPAAAAATCALAAAAARAAYAGLTRRPPAGQGTWTRTNHRGEAVPLLEGPAVAMAAVSAAALAPGLAARSRAARSSAPVTDSYTARREDTYSSANASEP